MRACLRFAFAGVLVTCSVIPCIAQSPTSPRTLETLLKEDEEPEPLQPETNTAKQPKPKMQGTYVRPDDAVQHPDLDKVWGTYDSAVTQANTAIAQALTQLFDAAADKGDLDAADKWQAQRQRFEAEGDLPDEKETQAAVKTAVQGLKVANEQLSKAYDVVVKSLTKDKKIAEAKAVRDEWRALEADVGTLPTIDKAPPSPPKTIAAKGERSPKGQPAKPVKLKPVTYRFANEAAIKQDWDILDNGWQIVNDSLELNRCRVRSKHKYTGDLRISVMSDGRIGVTVCGVPFSNPNALIIEKRGNVLTVLKGPDQEATQVQLKEAQTGDTAIELYADTARLIGVEILGTPIKEEQGLP